MITGNRPIIGQLVNEFIENMSSCFAVFNESRKENLEKYIDLLREIEKKKYVFLFAII